MKPGIILSELDESEPSIRESIHLDNLQLSIAQAIQISGLTMGQVQKAPSLNCLDFVIWLEGMRNQEAHNEDS